MTCQISCVHLCCTTLAKSNDKSIDVEHHVGFVAYHRCDFAAVARHESPAKGTFGAMRNHKRHVWSCFGNFFIQCRASDASVYIDGEHIVAPLEEVESESDVERAVVHKVVQLQTERHV